VGLEKMDIHADRTGLLIESDPLLKPYEAVIRRRLEKIDKMKTILTRNQTSLADFASGHEFFGLHFKAEEWIFREWAPNATAVFMIGDMTEWNITVVEVGGTSTHVVTDLEGGALLITCAGNEDDGVSMQLGAGAGENIALTAGQCMYFGIEFAINDVDQVDALFGATVTDTAVLGGVTDGLYFRTVDESAVLNFVTEKNSVESSTAVATLVDTTYVTAEFLFDGETVSAYINGGLISSTANSAATFPDDELLRLTLEVLSGEATANTCTIKWLRMIHLTQ